jgi:N-acetylmuramoyl-L-alanine amidase
MAFTYRTSLIPKGNRNRPGYKMDTTNGRARGITVHNTANPNATAANHVSYINSTDRSVSWHITVDDKEAVMHIPLNEQAWHTGTTAGNTTSVGIEVCEFTDPARARAAEANAVRLIAEMLTGKAPAGWNMTWRGLPNVATHKYWSGKICPRVILPHWSAFKADIQKQMDAINTPPPAREFVEVRIHADKYEMAYWRSAAAVQNDTVRFYPTTAESWKTWPSGI